VADAAAVTRTAYTPYGELRGGDNVAVDRGWLGQVEDRISADGASGTGLTYLNARYYDPALGRFLSPDPLMNPGDPRTLDPYVYSSNNPVLYTDASGLRQDVGGLKNNDEYYSNPANKDVNPYTGIKRKSGDRSGVPSGSSGGLGGAQGQDDALGLAEELFSTVDGIRAYFDTAVDLANEIVHLSDLASSLARKLAAGEKVGHYLASFRLDKNPLLHFASKIGTMSFVRIFSQVFGGREADFAYFLLDVVNHYAFDYDVIDNDIDRWEFSATHSFISATAGSVWDTSTDGAKDATCLLTGGTLCGLAIGTQGVTGWALQNQLGNMYMSQVLCDNAGICAPAPLPSMYGAVDPEGNPM
jgi:RHS repeat-associated protein